MIKRSCKVKWLKDLEDFDHDFDDECDDDGGYDDDVRNSWEVQGDVCFIKVRQLQLWLSEFQWKALSKAAVGDDDDDDDDDNAVDEVTDDDDWTLEVETKSEWDWHHSKITPRRIPPSSNP